MKWVAKTSSVRVSDQRGDRVYDSIEEIPGELRERIEKAVEKPAQTILIANPEALRQIEDASGELPDALKRIQQELSPAHVEETPKPRQRPAPAEPDIDWRILLGGGLAAIASLWALWIWSIRSGMS